MRHHSFQPIKTLLALLLMAGMTACANQVAVTSNSSVATADSRTEIAIEGNTSVNNQDSRVVFVTKSAATKLLATEDEYIKSLSAFDWQAKFKSNRKLSPSELSDYYAKATLEWDSTSEQKVLTAVKVLEGKITGLKLQHPATLKFLLTNGLVESGAAYTREDYIVLTTEMLSLPQSELNYIVAHEFFHVYSRSHQAEQDKMYAAVGFKQIPPLVLPSELDALRISNPDSPIMRFAVDLDYQGKLLTFVPLLHSNKEYDTASNLSFFNYLSNDLLAITVQDGQSKSLLINGKPLIVSAESTNYKAVVKPNSAYLHHPEEVSAENFSYWVVGKDIEHKAPVQKLITTMASIH
ncbi:MAG: hypothetical protein Q4P13_13170 [Psychrobacter sp.]|nr:hypothetical protein [Psychrobacter sp.]